ncbi:O-antigen polymerase [Sphingomonas aurantiaca]|uniref:O-antigen polymerase n=1 Tax=Sphingomonas aurantiaca TaxID=185949 RepID=A0A5E8ALZ9_9SPHN|nr:O-antigen ligase family protein [Sphingomonas aurantiaca]VVT32394.1 O-antigen polymerase [Sphingomonas aurantiaca]
MIRHAVIPAYLLICLLLGGASAAGFIANLTLQLAALPLIGWASWQMLQERPPASVRVPLALLVLFVTLALLQLIPMPPAAWTLLPGRGTVIEGYRLLGIPLPWLPLTLAPEPALASLLWLLPAFAVMLGVIILGAFRARHIAAVIVAVTFASVMIGALQVIGGSSAYFYRITNYGVAVGFFANANHNATLLLVCIPFLAALQKVLLKKSGSQRSASAIRLLVGATYAVIIVGLLINSSLAGIGLGVPVALWSWLTFGRQRAGVRRGLGIATGLVSIAVLATIVIGPFGNNLFGQQTSNVELSRQTSFRLTLQAAAEYFPVGSGIGSFQSVYRTQEPLATVRGTFMNHAHSDWIELLLETGLAGVVFTALFLAWWSVRLRAIWCAEEPEPFAQAAVIASAAILMHSLVDYPLRTAALSAVFGACIGLMSGVRPYTRRSRLPSSARHLSL